jgi:dienelactone hydrolase
MPCAPKADPPRFTSTSLLTDSGIEPRADVGECHLLETDSATALKAQRWVMSPMVRSPGSSLPANALPAAGLRRIAQRPVAVAFLYWTTRGFGVVDVNYRGSSGYGREYRNRLRGTWGIVDVEDAQAAARYLAEQGEVDAERLVITGGSAGGYTTLAALAFGDVFRAGSSYFGVADLELLAKHTHKFESRYLDGLVGTDVEEMRRRSPLYSADRIDVPVILFQGLDDQVVPPEQAEMIAAALEERGVPYALVTYEGEDHGFRQAKNIVHSLESELAFYALVLRFTPDGELPEVPIVGELSPTRQAVDT